MNIKSMTGYGRFEKIDENRKIVIDIKSVNHRYSDITIKLPRAYMYLEEKIRDYILSKVSRGKIDVYVYIENYQNGDKEIIIDSNMSKSYYNALCELKEMHGLAGEISVSDMLRFSDIFISKQQEEDKEEVWQTVLDCLSPAADDFVLMRQREGGRMADDVKEKAANILAMTEKIEKLMPEITQNYVTALKQRIDELIGDFKAEESRILTEAAIIADKMCVSEETVRLKSHIKELLSILEEDEPVGRKLDFLVQELNREANTIGSKVSDVDISKTVVLIKAEIEKLREQIQNIE